MTAFALSPHAHVHLDVRPPEEATSLEQLPDAILKAFEGGSAAGLLQLGASDLNIALPPTFAYWRGVAQQFFTRLSATSATDDPMDSALAAPTATALAELAAAAPPMTGGEYLSAEALATI